MFRITFKNVGAGDSIILEWQIKENWKIGIIDCHKYKGTNPVVDYLKTIKPTQIDFIALSHPHKDHYSGLLELLEHCELNKINVTSFFHTMPPHPAYLNLAEEAEEDVALLDEIMRKGAELNDNGLIATAGSIGANYELSLSAELRLKCLAPTDIENRQFTAKIDYFKPLENLDQCSSAANYLSTVLLIYCDTWSLLITSDAVRDTFDRLLEREFETLTKSKILLGQVPHHGSKKNHHSTFWRSFKYDPNCPAVISAGLGKNKHPDFEVVKDFEDSNYKTYVTNLVNGAKRYYDEYTKEEIALELALDDTSEILDEEIPLAGDQMFELTKYGFTRKSL